MRWPNIYYQRLRRSATAYQSINKSINHVYFEISQHKGWIEVGLDYPLTVKPEIIDYRIYKNVTGKNWTDGRIIMPALGSYIFSCSETWICCVRFLRHGYATSSDSLRLVCRVWSGDCLSLHAVNTSAGLRQVDPTRSMVQVQVQGKETDKFPPRHNPPDKIFP